MLTLNNKNLPRGSLWEGGDALNDSAAAVGYASKERWQASFDAPSSGRAGLMGRRVRHDGSALVQGGLRPRFRERGMVRQPPDERGAGGA